MKLSLKNIAITLGIAAGAAAAAVITTKSVKKPSVLSLRKNEVKEKNMVSEKDKQQRKDEDILYV